MPCIVLIGGIPGTGKSELIRFLLTYKNEFNFLHTDVEQNGVRFQSQEIPSVKVNGAVGMISIYKIIFDEICSIEDQAKIVKKMNGWRQFRIQLLEAAERYMCATCDVECHMQGPLSLRSQEIFEKLTVCNIHVNNSQNSHRDAIFLIEDNFYYSSMRYEWFQVAKRNGMGFCQIMMKCPLELAIQRNKEREYTIPENKIKLMSSYTEYPDTMKNRWEKFSLVFESDTLLNYTSVSPIVELIRKAMSQPAEIMENEKRLEAQMICSKSVLHQADRILRKLTGELIQQLKEQNGHLIQEKAIAEITKTRHKLYQELKQGIIQLPSNIIEDIEQSGINFSENYNNLEQILRNLYKQEYNFPHS